MGTGAAVVYGVTMVAGAIMNAENNKQEAKRQEKQANYNAAVVGEQIKAVNYEEAMNKTLTTLNARQDIGVGKNSMAGARNIGSSADSAVLNAYSNLAGDLEAMTFNYENKRVDLQTQRNNYLYNAEIARENKNNAFWGGVLGVTGSAIQAYTLYSTAGGKYGIKSPYWDIGSYVDETGKIQQTWHGGLFGHTFGQGGQTTAEWEKAFLTTKAYYGTSGPYGATNNVEVVIRPKQYPGWNRLQTPNK